MKVGRAALLMVFAAVLLVLSGVLVLSSVVSGNVLMAVLYGLTGLISVVFFVYRATGSISVHSSIDSLDLPDDAKICLRTPYNVCVKACKSVETKKEQFMSYPESDSLRKTYELIRNRVVVNMDRACKYASNYDYITLPDPEYLRKLAQNSKEMVDKLNELSDLALQVEDTATEVGTAEADDMLAALREILKEDDVL